MKPTPYHELNEVLQRLAHGAEEALGDTFVGAYLQGSFATGSFDLHSDVDFLVVLEEELSARQEAKLQSLHDAIFAMETPWARHLEGSYVPRVSLRFADPARKPWLYIDNGSRALERSNHDNTLVVRWVTRERGVTLAGPPPRNLIEPVAAAALRLEVEATIHEWGDELLASHSKLDSGWAQPFAVLSFCRMLQTLETGTVESKPAGAAWAQQKLDPRWAGLIERAWQQRPDPALKARQRADPADLALTREFISYAIALADADRDATENGQGTDGRNLERGSALAGPPNRPALFASAL